METILKEYGLYGAKLLIVDFFKKFDIDNIDDTCLKSNVSKYKLSKIYTNLGTNIDNFNIFGWDLIHKNHLLKMPPKPKYMVVEGKENTDYEVKLLVDKDIVHFDYSHFNEKTRVYNLVVGE